MPVFHLRACILTEKTAALRRPTAAHRRPGFLAGKISAAQPPPTAALAAEGEYVNSGYNISAVVISYHKINHLKTSAILYSDQIYFNIF